MENASKALIIAGAILLSILIISLGLMVYNQAKETVGSVNLSQQEIEAFNAKFTSYEGTKVSGSKVNALIQTVISSNEAEVQNNSFNLISIDADTNATMITTTATTYDVGEPARVTTGKTYTVTFGYNKGVINSINIVTNND